MHGGGRAWASTRAVVQVVRRCLEEGSAVEIDGLGVFRPRGGGRFEFAAECRPKVFIAYVEEERPAAERLSADLEARRFDPWMDRRKLMPGQNWPRAIERAIQVSDFFLALLSRRSLAKRGSFQSELRFALECAARMPLEEIYFIPARLDACTVPARIAGEFHYVDLFPDWDQGVARVASVMRRRSRRARRALRL